MRLLFAKEQECRVAESQPSNFIGWFRTMHHKPQATGPFGFWMPQMYYYYIYIYICTVTGWSIVQGIPGTVIDCDSDRGKGMLPGTPPHYRNVAEFNNGCNHIGLPCDENPEYDCFCRPFVKAFEVPVDVYPFDGNSDDPHLKETYEASLPGCEKVEICGTFKQRGSISMRIFDNMLRDDAEVTILVHAGEKRRDITRKNV